MILGKNSKFSSDTVEIANIPLVVLEETYENHGFISWTF